MKRAILFSLFSAVLMMLLVASVSAQHVATTPSDKPDEWWTKRHAGNVEQMSKGNIDLLMIGDSITHGWENAGKKYWDMYYAQRKPINLGFSGDRTENVLWRLDNLPLDKISPKAAMLMIGTNNVGHGSSNPQQAAEGILEIVKRLEKAFPEMKVLVLNVFPRDPLPNGDMRKKVDEINALLPELLKDQKNVRLLNLNDKFLESNSVLSPSIMPDYLHPNEKGYGIWARSVEPVLEELLGEKNIATQPAHRMSEQWWKDRQAGNQEQVEKGDVGLLMIGDSITHGWDGQVDLWKKTFGEYVPINMGFGGDQTQHVLWRLNNLPLEKISPRGAMIMIGTNNTGDPRMTPYQVAEGVKAIVDKLQEKFPNIKIVILDVFPRSEKPNDPLRLRVDEINAALPMVLAGLKNVTLVNINEQFLTPEGILTREVMPDYLHPNDFGYHIWSNAVGPALSTMFQ
ncbi:MAG: GDSL-type esterase/lipase family protein [Thermoguttaceae bacterium]